MLLRLERCSAPGKAGLQFADALAGKRSVRFVVTSIIPNLGHGRNRCQKPVPITPLRVARTRRTPDRTVNAPDAPLIHRESAQPKPPSSLRCRVKASKETSHPSVCAACSKLQ